MNFVAPLSLIVLLVLSSSAEAVTCRCDSLSADSTKKEEQEKSGGEIRIRVGNESNQVDGVFGPFTYGLAGGYTFANGAGVEVTIIRLHEPGSPTFNSFLDEEQLSLNLPEVELLKQHLSFAATVWSNRMIDMYTDVGGIEVSDKWGSLSMSLDLYGGTAVRDELGGRFFGGRIGMSHKFGDIEVALEQMAGLIRTPGDPTSLGGGSYQKTALGANTEVNLFKGLLITLTLSLEKRYFDFGNGGPANDPLDAYILVLGVALDVLHLLSPSN